MIGFMIKDEEIFHLFFYVPETHLEIVKAAIFKAGAGQVGNYENCAWQTKGEGQFLPISGSDPFIGEIGKLEKVIEYKVETVCKKECLDAVIAALKSSHPYDIPAFGVVVILN